MLLLVLAFAAFRWADGHANSVAARKAHETAELRAALLASELQKFQLLPVVLPEYPDIAAVLRAPDPGNVARLNGKLALVAERTDANVIYLLDRDGTTLAASNYRRADSFVGQRYGFRPYFRDALANGAAQLFALGTVSGRPGLYIARRIGPARAPLGVIVVKVEFDRIEESWRSQPGPTIVADDHGVVLITSRSDWRFRARLPLDAATLKAVRQTLQFGDAPVQRLAVTPMRHDRYRFDGQEYAAADAAVPLLGATVTVFQPLAPERTAAYATVRTILLAAVVLLILAGATLLRARDRRAMQRAAREALETEVAARTAELRETNARLVDESRRRADADARYRRAREELAQANRLGSIGQITAGVAHEVNQPVAAIRTFAENADTFLARAETDKARRNLALIVGLTERIGAITAELRSFARRGTPEVGTVELSAVLDGTLLLVGDSIRGEGVTLERLGDPSGIRVRADRTRLEQILVNLVQNALHALRGTPRPTLRIAVADGAAPVLTVADNGPGIAADIVDEIFTPFVTGRPDGLGLGLGIARDIAREFGGDLVLIPSPLGGAAFQLRLKRA